MEGTLQLKAHCSDLVFYAKLKPLLISLCADGIPILMRIINNRRFEPGPFNLGRYGPYIGSVAVAWVVVITVSYPAPFNLSSKFVLLLSSRIFLGCPGVCFWRAQGS